MATDLQPRAIAFVGKAAYQGTYRERPELGLQERRVGDALLYVLPSTSPANAAVPWDERLRWFRALRELLNQTSGS
jgi:G:T/U-mismatch repair DNA glycosylase